MMFKTHLAFGFLIGLIVIMLFNISHPVIFLLLVTLFSGLPDIDHPKSVYGRKLFFLSIPISWVSNHRGIFHSIFPPVIAFIILGNFGYALLGLSVFVGYLSHLFGDALTKQGINFLHPLSTFEIKGPIETGHFLEALLFFIILLLDIIYTLKLTGLLYYL